MYMFTGEGEDLLTGVSVVQGPQAELDDVRRGGTGDGISMLDIDFDWLGFIRSENNTPTFYVRPGVSMTQKQTPEWVSNITNILIGIVTGGVAIIATGGAGVPVQVFAGTTGGTVSGFFGGNWYVDALDMSPHDCQVKIGPIYFNYQQTPGVAGWTMEKFQMSLPVVTLLGNWPRK